MAIPIAATLSVSTTAFSGGIKLAGKALGGLVAVAKAATLAIVGLTAAFSALVLRQTAIIDRIGKISKVTGVAAETLQKFSFAAELAGVSTDQAQVALRRFSRRLGEAQKGTGELLPALRRLGIQVRNNDGTLKSAEEVLFELAEGIKNTEGESAKLAIAFKAFDSEGAELVNTLSKGGDALREVFDEATRLGFVLNSTAIQGVEDFNDEFNKLQAIIGGVANQFTSALAPVLKEITEDFTDFISKVAKDKGGFESLGNFLKNEFIDIVIAVTTVFSDFVNAVVRLGRSIPGTDLFPVTGLRAKEEYNKIADGVNLLNRALKSLDPSGVRSSFEAIRNPNLTRDTFEELKRLGVITTQLEKEFEDLSFIQKYFGSIADQTALNEFKENFRRALTLGLEIADDELSRFDLFDNTSLVEYLESLKDVGQTSVEFVKEFKVATTETNRELDLTLGYWERIILQIGDFFTRDLPEKIKQTIEQLKAIGKTVAERLLELSDPIKTLEDGLVKAGQSFEDALVNAIMTGKANFEDFRNILRETLARALVQRFITGPIFDLFRAKGGPVKQGNPYIVGEEGPELFVPGATGTIIPNNNLQNGGGAATTVNYNIQAVDAPSFQSLVARDPEFIYNVSRAGARRTPVG